jgi:hypothetical protein
MELVTVYRSFSPAEAQLIRSRLDAADIPAAVMNELAALSLDGYSMAAGGVLVQVPENYVEEARALIGSADSPPEPETPDETGGVKS